MHICRMRLTLNHIPSWPRAWLLNKVKRYLNHIEYAGFDEHLVRSGLLHIASLPTFDLTYIYDAGTPYRIRVYTGNRPFAGTNAMVKIRIRLFPFSSTPWITLNGAFPPGSYVPILRTESYPTCSSPSWYERIYLAACIFR